MEEDKSFFERILDEAKFTIYEVVHGLLKEDGCSFWIRIVFIFIETMQLLSFCFMPQIQDRWKNTTMVQGLQDYLSSFILDSLYSYTSFNAFLVIFYIFAGIVILMLCILSYIIYQVRNRKLMKKEERVNMSMALLRVYADLASSIFFLPIFNTFLII